MARVVPRPSRLPRGRGRAVRWPAFRGRGGVSRWLCGDGSGCTPAAAFDQELGFQQGVEAFAVEAFVAQLAAEGFHIAVDLAWVCEDGSEEAGTECTRDVSLGARALSSAQAPGADQQGTFVVAVNDDHPAGEPIESVATLPTRGDRNPADNRSPALEAAVRLSAEYDALPQGGLITYTIILDNSEESSQRVTVEVTPDANTTFVPAGSDAAWVEEAGVQRASFFVDCGFCSNQFTLVVAVARLGSGAATGRRCTAIGPGVVQRKRPGGRVRWLGGGSRRGLSGGGCADRLMAEVGRCVGEPSRGVAREAWPDYPRGIGLWLAG